MTRVVLFTFVVAAMMMTGCRQSDSGGSGFQLVTPAAAATPGFLQVGSTYTISSGMSGMTATVLEIDQKAGWIKIGEPGAQNPGKEVWINLAQVYLIQK